MTLPGIDQSQIKRAAEAVSDSQDAYAGLDRFGRVINQRALKTSTSGPYMGPAIYGCQQISLLLLSDPLSRPISDQTLSQKQICMAPLSYSTVLFWSAFDVGFS